MIRCESSLRSQDCGYFFYNRTWDYFGIHRNCLDVSHNAQTSFDMLCHYDILLVRPGNMVWVWILSDYEMAVADQALNGTRQYSQIFCHILRSAREWDSGFRRGGRTLCDLWIYRCFDFDDSCESLGFLEMT